MWYVYFDESGTGSLEREPYLVVSGIILHADHQWARAAESLRRIAIDEVGEERAAGLIFHAKELLNGGKRFPRSEWPRDRAMAALKRVVTIPRDLKITVLCNAVRKSDFMRKGRTVKEAIDKAHEHAFLNCIGWAEEFMRKNAGETELATVVAEDRAGMKQRLKAAFRKMHSKDAKNYVKPKFQHLFPLTKFVDTVHCVDKEDAPLLQIADACAHTIRRRLSCESNCEALFDALHVEIYRRSIGVALPAVEPAQSS
ncbi:MAG: DUF3800 domain-containing protein [Hyphomonadaceae bacterium]